MRRQGHRTDFDAAEQCPAKPEDITNVETAKSVLSVILQSQLVPAETAKLVASLDEWNANIADVWPKLKLERRQVRTQMDSTRLKVISIVKRQDTLNRFRLLCVGSAALLNAVVDDYIDGVDESRRRVIPTTRGVEVDLQKKRPTKAIEGEMIKRTKSLLRDWNLLVGSHVSQADKAVVIQAELTPPISISELRLSDSESRNFRVGSYTSTGSSGRSKLSRAPSPEHLVANITDEPKAPLLQNTTSVTTYGGATSPSLWAPVPPVADEGDSWSLCFDCFN